MTIDDLGDYDFGFLCMPLYHYYRRHNLETVKLLFRPRRQPLNFDSLLGLYAPLAWPQVGRYQARVSRGGRGVFEFATSGTTYGDVKLGMRAIIGMVETGNEAIFGELWV